MQQTSGGQAPVLSGPRLRRPARAGIALRALVLPPTTEEVRS
jgi:hypothetical protein